MHDILINIIGYSGAVVGVSIMLPQVYKSLKTKSVEDVSWGMLVLYFVNCALWLAYGILIGALPVTVTNAVALVISVVQIGIKVRYSK
ncbi:MAG TPA: SemiSWEET family transporter [Candidatus Paceibacterota bacterium]